MGRFYVDTEEILNGTAWSAGDYGTACDCYKWEDNHFDAHFCVDSRTQFNAVFDRFHEDQPYTIDTLTADIKANGQKWPGDVVLWRDKLILHNGHHRLYVCNLLNLPYFIDVAYD